jgi:hypothetical protein
MISQKSIAIFGKENKSRDDRLSFTETTKYCIGKQLIPEDGIHGLTGMSRATQNSCAMLFRTT